MLVVSGVLLCATGCQTSDGSHEAASRPTTLAGIEQPRPPARTEPMKAIWVARMHYHYPDDIRTIMRNIADAGLNTVLWQVRGNATVAYPSKLEPWSRHYEYEDPGFDPLAIAVEAAHENGLRIEAWINVMPGWSGAIPPPIQNQLYRTHPEWFLRDADGQRQALTDFYVILNPAYPEVRDHITAVAREIVTNYNVDGLHLDYVRYAWDGTPKGKQRFPRDQRTLAIFRSEMGMHPDDDPDAWDEWRADQITRLVEQIRTMTRKERPGLTLTAAVVRDPQRAYHQYLQDGTTWLIRDLVDALMPMAYTTDTARFVAHIQTYRQRAAGGRIIPGIGLYKFDAPNGICDQLRHTRAWGGEFALFSYASLHPTAAHREQLPLTSAQQEAWLMRRAALERCIAPQR
jgi:uncharacterized lipoprotein YddW (UPF0748 family)